MKTNKPIGICECCGIEIYDNEEYALIGGSYLCNYCGGDNGMSISKLKERGELK